MPIYQYRCKHCGDQIEVLQKHSDPMITDCVVCAGKNGGGSMEKCITAPSFRLSGGGYYETDEKPKAKQRHVATNSDATSPTSA